MTGRDRPRSRCPGRSPGSRSRGRRSYILLGWRRRHERGRAVMESPRRPIAVEDVAVAADELYAPAVVAQQDEDDVTRGRGLVVVPGLDDRVEDEVSLRPAGGPL